MGQPTWYHPTGGAYKVKVLKHIAAFIVSIIVYFIVFLLISLIIYYLGKIPILGAILYYPSDASWALITLPVFGAMLSATYISSKIAGGCRPFSVAIILLYLFNIIAMFVLHNFAWREFATSAVSIFAASICLKTNGFDEQEK